VILAGHSVLYYTLEMAADIVMNRIDAMATGVPFVDLIRHASTVEERWGILSRHFKMGEIYLHDLPPRYLTPNMIRRHLRQYHDKGITPSVVVVDYADIMASDKAIEERRLEHGDVYEQLRGVAKEFGVGMLTASQANRDSLRRKTVDLDSLAEDFSKAMTADYVIGLSQIKSEEVITEDGRGTGIMRAFIAKNRNGRKGVEAEFMTDFTKMRVSMRDMDSFDRDHFGKII
jgi:replicative DNA helicase